MQDLPIIQLKICKLKTDPFLFTNNIDVYSFGKHSLLQDFELKYPSLFTTTYFCEYTFSNMKHTKSKERNTVLYYETLIYLLRISTSIFKFILLSNYIQS